jgi:predicted nucleic acid-binding Zn ribbon protein
MATYQYECELDGVFDYTFVIGTAPESAPCKVCGGETERKFNTFAAVFKGTGWGGSK